MPEHQSKQHNSEENQVTKFATQLTRPKHEEKTSFDELIETSGK